MKCIGQINVFNHLKITNYYTRNLKRTVQENCKISATNHLQNTKLSPTKGSTEAGRFITRPRCSDGDKRDKISIIGRVCLRR